MQIHRTFTWQLDREYGNYGWLLENAPDHFNTGDGLMVAHDTMEHLVQSDGSLSEELIAFGAIMITRAEPGYFAMRGSAHGDPAIHTASDIHGFMRNYFLGGEWLPEPPTTRPLYHHQDIESIIQRSMKLAKKGFLEDFSYQDFDEAPTSVELDRFLDMCIGWMRLGVLRAKRAYRFNKGDDLLHTFTSIENEVKAKHMSNHHNEGDKLHVELDTYTLKWRVWDESLEEQWQEEEEDEEADESPAFA